MIVVLVPKPELTGAVFSNDLINDFETVKIVTFDHHVTDRDKNRKLFKKEEDIDIVSTTSYSSIVITSVSSTMCH